MVEIEKALIPALIDEGLLSKEDAETINEEIKMSSDRICKILVALGFIDELRLASFLSKYLDIPFVNLLNQQIDGAVTRIIPADIARKYIIIPLFDVMGALTVAMGDPLDYQAIEEIEYISGKRIEPVVSTISEINTMLDKHYGAHTSIRKIIENLEQEDFSKISIEDFAQSAFSTSETSGPINQLVHLIISYAIRERASDIHLEPTDLEFQIRFRIDGVLVKMLTFPKHLSSSIVSSIKILAKMDIAEKRVPLDGGFQVNVENEIIDLRVSSFPVLQGEKVVIRVLNKSSIMLNLDQLGMGHNISQKFLPIINKSHGIILVTGPTGSGKTSTLYSILNRIKSMEKNIVTIEDPIEYRLEMINQSQVNPKAGLSFAKGLRSMLRQDPDIILVGEIRDMETAEIAFQAAMTGHLVLSTLHTNDAASSITRLIDMGIEPFLVASSIIGVLAQRLVRKICPACRREYVPSQEEMVFAGLAAGDTASNGVFSLSMADTKKAGEKKRSVDRFYKGEGCKECKGTGYTGRMGIFELLDPSERLKQTILKNGISSSEIKRIATEEGMVTLQEDGLNKVFEHKTTITEIMRVAR